MLSLVIVRCLSIISSVIVARTLGKTNLGMLSIVNNLNGLVALFAAIGIPTALTRFVAQSAAEDRTRLPAVVGTSLGVMLVPLLVLSAGLFLGAGAIARGIYHEPALTPLIQISAFIVLLSALGAGGFGQGLLQGLKEVKRISVINSVASFVNVPVVIGLTLLFNLTGTITAQLAVAAVGLVLTVVSVAGYLRAIPPEPSTRRRLLDLTFVPALLNLAFPAFLSGLVMVPAMWLTTTRLQSVSGFADVGLFNICLALYQVILFLPTAVGMPLFPLIAESWPGDIERLRRLTRVSLELVGFVTLLLATALAVFARPIVLGLYGDGYREAIAPLVLMAGAGGLSSLTYVIGMYFAGTGKMWTGMAANILWFGVLLVASFLMITPWGPAGLTGAFMIAYAVQAAALLIYARVRIRIPVGYPVLLALLTLVVTGVGSRLVLLTGALYWVAAGLLFVAVTVLAYALLGAKPELRASVASVFQNLRRRISRAPDG